MNLREKEIIEKLYSSLSGWIDKKTYQAGIFTIKREVNFEKELGNMFGKNHDFLAFVGEDNQNNRWIDIAFYDNEIEYVISLHFKKDEFKILIETGYLTIDGVMWDNGLFYEYDEIIRYIEWYIIEKSSLRIEILTNTYTFYRRYHR